MSDEDRGAKAVPWAAPSMSPPGGVHSHNLFPDSPVSPPTAADLAAWEEAGRQEGFERGYAEGREAAQAELTRHGACLQSVLDSARNALHDFDELAEQELLQLSVILAQQLVRRELRVEPGEIVAVVREALGILPSSARRVRVCLHPDDLPIVKQAFPATDADGDVALVEDPLITRGGCRLLSESSRVDATLESRLASLAATVLGGSREEDG